MKKFTLKVVIMIFVLAYWPTTQSMAQSILATVLTQPCNNNGKIGVTAIGFTPPISYTYANWAGQQVVHNAVTTNTDVFNNIPSYQNNYITPNLWGITASDGVHTAYTTVTLTAPFVCTVNTIYANCPALSTVQAVSFAGGTAPYTCVWTNTNTNLSYSSNPAAVPNGNYTLEVTDAAGCKIITGGTTNIGVGSIPGFTLSTAGTAANCSNGTATVTVTGGTGPFTYLWSNGATTQAIANLLPGFQTCTVTAANGCQGYTSYFVNQAVTINGIVSGSPANCTNGTATITPSGGLAPYTCLWDNGSTAFTRSGLIMGSISCTLTDANGCKGSVIYGVPQAVTINYTSSIANASCALATGTITSFVSGGTAPYTFAWSNGATSANLLNVLGGQAYQVHITDASGCQGFGSAYVGVNTPINVTNIISASNCTTATGAATINATGGNPPYTYVWNLWPNNVSGQVINNKPIGSYAFSVMDASGCVRNGIVIIPPNTNLSASINSQSVLCPATTGSLAVVATGSNLPFTYIWTNGITTATNGILNLGAHSCTVTDAMGCTYMTNGLLQQGNNMSIGFSVTPATCMFSNNGAIIASAAGGLAPYTYQWVGGSNSNINANLLPGNYRVYVTAANGCSTTASTWVSYNSNNTSCYCIITGTVYNDINSNCQQSFGELGIPNIPVHCTGFGTVYSDANGVYSFNVPSGTYTISQSVQPYYPLANCQNNNQIVNVTAAANCVVNVNFANNTIPIHDLHIITGNLNLPVPGNAYNQLVIVQNEGTMPESNMRLAYKHDGQLNFLSGSYNFTQPNSGSFPTWYRVNSGMPSLSPNGSYTGTVTYTVPSNIPISTAVLCNDTIANAPPVNTVWLTDQTPWNNVDNHTVYTVASYDPNFKEVSPAGTGPQGNITSNDSILTYIVHFQNTGSYFAQNIVVIDSLDPNVKISSLRPGTGSNKFTTTISDNGVCRFSFDNINLPWLSQYGDKLSSGYFVYSVKLKNNLSLGTQIKNKAAIYFDYNAPIITNTTRNTLASIITSSTGIKNQSSNPPLDLLLYPNPASSKLYLKVSTEVSESGIIQLFDVSGRQLANQSIELIAGENVFYENTSMLKAGIYFVSLKTERGVLVKKLVIEIN